MKTVKASLTIAALLLNFGLLSAQNITTQNITKYNAITTAVPFLTIGPDARSGGMGDAGIGLPPDAFGNYWCLAKMPYADKNIGVGVTFTPWLKALVNDIYMGNVSAYYKLNGGQVLTPSLRYFSLGSIQFTDASGNDIGTFSPHEFSYDVGYSRLLADHFSMGAALRYVYSNLAKGYNSSPGVAIKAGNAAAADLSFMYSSKRKPTEADSQSHIKSGTTHITYNIGVNISNLGNKMTYTGNAQDKDYLPANLGVGGAVNFLIDRYNKLTLLVDFNKLLVPTPDTLVSNGQYVYKTYSVPESEIKALTYAPGGSKEKLEEINISGGAEYTYNKIFAFRAGYFSENKYKGNRKYMTMGFGLNFNAFGLNLSYLIPTNAQKNPLDNTLRFTLLFNFDALDKGEEVPTE